MHITYLINYIYIFTVMALACLPLFCVQFHLYPWPALFIFSLEDNLGHSPGEQHLAELESTFSAYKVSGFPINMPYNEISTIVDAVFSTRVHAHETSDVEFALAVYIHPYPNDVLSVWVYVASLIRSR